jgi:cupin fold WbuC family metalloprotein
MTHTSWIDAESLVALSAGALQNARLRKNFNLHRMEDPVHRLLNAIEPGTYIRPHRHLHPARTETVIRVSGSMGAVIFSSDGGVIDQRILGEGESVGVDLAPETWHSFVALSSGTVFFEAKAGPFEPIPEIDLAPWAPAQGTSGAAAYERGLRELFGS